jgi:UDP-N-acetylmuramoylalanine--D-glutamate ligase
MPTISRNYIDSKFRVIQNQTQSDYFIFWADDPVIKTELKKRELPMILLPFSADF